jgi:hypothetical protein
VDLGQVVKENKDWEPGTLLEVTDRIASYSDARSKTQGAVWLEVGEVVTVVPLDESLHDLAWAKLITCHGIVYMWKPYANIKVVSLAR